MRILTVRQPWAAAIIHPSINPTNGAMRVKDVENRTTNIAGDYRGPVAIHVAKAWDEVAFKRPSGVLKAWWDWQLASDLDRGHIIGVVDLTDVHDAADCWDESLHNVARLYREDREAFDALPVLKPELGGLSSRVGFCSPWALGEHQHLKLAQPRALRDQIPYKGALGLRHLDADTIALIESRLP